MKILFYILLFFSTGSLIAKDEVPCDEQEDLEISDYCIKTYKCPKADTNNNLTLVGVHFNGQLFGTVALDQNNTFKQIKPRMFSSAPFVFWGEKKLKSKVSYDVSFDHVETGRCDYSYKFDPIIPSSGLFMFTNSNSKKLNLKIRVPSHSELKIFEKSHTLCKKSACTDEDEWNINNLFAVSDVNNDGKKEYWYYYVDGYRRWYKAEEYNPKSKIWNTIQDF